MQFKNKKCYGGMPMKKTYVLDTNVLIQAPYATSCFEDNDVIIPLKVVEELDGLLVQDRPFVYWNNYANKVIFWLEFH